MRVLAINDVSCIGKCSLTSALPIISACGVECNVLPTAILSTHTGGFTGYTFRDLTEDIEGILQHWKSLGVKFDYILSGYLGSIEQIQLVSSIKKEFLAEHGKFIVDPVMGDSCTQALPLNTWKKCAICAEKRIISFPTSRKLACLRTPPTPSPRKTRNPS